MASFSANERTIRLPADTAAAIFCQQQTRAKWSKFDTMKISTTRIYLSITCLSYSLSFISIPSIYQPRSSQFFPAAQKSYNSINAFKFHRLSVSKPFISSLSLSANPSFAEDDIPVKSSLPDGEFDQSSVERSDDDFSAQIECTGSFRERFGDYLPAWLTERLEQGGFSVPTSVQAEAIETVVIQGRDALVQAYTGPSILDHGLIPGCGTDFWRSYGRIRQDARVSGASLCHSGTESEARRRTKAAPTRGRSGCHRGPDTRARHADY